MAAADAANASAMSSIPPPETVKVKELRVACDGAGDIAPALGHPRVYLHIDDNGYVECGKRVTRLPVRDRDNNVRIDTDICSTGRSL